MHLHPPYINREDLLLETDFVSYRARTPDLKKTVTLPRLPLCGFSEEERSRLVNWGSHSRVNRYFNRTKENEVLFGSYLRLCRKFIRSFCESLNKDLIEMSHREYDYLDIEFIEYYPKSSICSFYLGDSYYELIEPVICKKYCDTWAELGLGLLDPIEDFHEVCRQINVFRMDIMKFSSEYPDQFFEWLLSEETE